MPLTEPDVALTDWLLTLECMVFVLLLAARPRQPLRDCFLGIFGCIGTASLLGGIVHGCFAAPTSFGHRLLWPITLVTLVAMAAFVWLAGVQLLVAPACRRLARCVAAATFPLGAGYVVFVDASFWVVVCTYFPAVVWLAAGYVAEVRRRRDRRLVLGLLGLLLTLVAGGLQQTGVALHPRYFDHNALYHAVQAIALLLVFRSTRELAPAPIGAGGSCAR
ncbi:MAG: hypothetical protein WAT39_09670 [Planctomycetota bacterium]